MSGKIYLEGEKRPFPLVGKLIMVLGGLFVVVSMLGGHEGGSITTATHVSHHADVDIGAAGHMKGDRNDSGVMLPVVVFRSTDAMAKSNQLYKAGAEDMIYRHIACFVDHGTKVLNITGEITNAFVSGLGDTLDVMVLEGPQRGCRGVILEQYLDK